MMIGTVTAVLIRQLRNLMDSLQQRAEGEDHRRDLRGDGDPRQYGHLVRRWRLGAGRPRIVNQHSSPGQELRRHNPGRHRPERGGACDMAAFAPGKVLAPTNGFLFLERQKFRASFAGDQWK
ncbi:MAG TPA: hypothetical protein VHJ18_00420 [Streptosporangiaceae bacterium]|nr:hypothetical protein [Streptosporangiaceae bacterium]